MTLTLRKIAIHQEIIDNISDAEGRIREIQRKLAECLIFEESDEGSEIGIVFDNIHDLNLKLEQIHSELCDIFPECIHFVSKDKCSFRDVPA